MRLSIPVLVETVRDENAWTVYTARPLFFTEPQARDRDLRRLTAKIGRDLQRQLDRLGKEARHDDLAQYTFHPRLQSQRVELKIELRRRLVRARYLIVTFRHHGRRIAMVPSLPELWFDLQRGESAASRATEVLTTYFRGLERDAEEDTVHPEQYAIAGTAFLTTVELDYYPPGNYKAPEPIKFLMMGGGEPVSGADELNRVGRCLNWQSPDDLDEVAHRDSELAELTRLLHAPDRRPVILVGPRQAGKTALIQAYVRQRVIHERAAQRGRHNVWLISPARLISGMSFVGQWENRLLAILRESSRRSHLLYFDDLLGLFHAGQTCQSDLSIAHVLKPYIERREVRVLAEITPEALRVLRERDRGFADLFHILPIAEMDDDATRGVLVHVRRQLEERHRCRFENDVIPVVLELTRRYQRDAAYPGKAAGFMRQLAVKHRTSDIDRGEVFDEFKARSGLSVWMISGLVKLQSEDVVKTLREQLVGQDDAIEAIAEVITIAKARLNDPDRPLASFLLLGPTGVGKTQCAKAVAAFLLGDADRLLRFDMNEFVAPGSAGRLIGTFSQPEGLLTAAVRRQPFAVLLFDEIEKADPEVFDMLLAVLGEGRLTDALGRTTDFSNTLILMTSNLGVREAESSIGFSGGSSEDRATAYTRAAERFFRPEFFNRLDRVIPFGRLDRATVRDIASKLIREVFAREGLVQRKCVLQVDDAAMERIIDAGFDPELGARALKRSIERHLTQPVADQLSALRPESFTIVRIGCRQQGITAEVQGLEPVPSMIPAGGWPTGSILGQSSDLAASLRELRSAVRLIEDRIAPWRPTGDICAGTLTPDQERYFAVKDRLEQLKRTLHEFEDRTSRDRVESVNRPSYWHPDRHRRHQFKVIRNLDHPGGPLLQQMASALDLNEFLNDLANSANENEFSGIESVALWQELKLLQMMMESDTADAVCVLAIRGLPGRDGVFAPAALAQLYVSALTEEIALDAAPVFESDRAPLYPGSYLEVRGWHARKLLATEVGTHLFCPAHAGVIPVQVSVLPVVTDSHAAIADWFAKREQRRRDVGAVPLDPTDDPDRFGPVVRIYHSPGSVFDLRSGMIASNPPDAQAMRGFLLAPLLWQMVSLGNTSPPEVS
jgi:ATP-dependent Clp protease ATP-binding subunit ClpA